MADDDDDDKLLMSAVFKDSQLKVSVNTVSDGEELMDYLLGKRKYSSFERKQPLLILMDLNMPKKDGRSALSEIKKNPSLYTIPVVIYSTSNNSKDMAEAYKLGANSYIIKPSNYYEIKSIVESITNCWITPMLASSHSPGLKAINYYQ